MTSSAKIWLIVILTLGVGVAASLLLRHKEKPGTIPTVSNTVAVKTETISDDDTSMKNRHDYYAITTPISDFQKSYIADSAAKIYNSEDLEVSIATLFAGDSVEIAEDDHVSNPFFYPDSVYMIKFWSNHLPHEGYINGKFLGKGGNARIKDGSDSVMMLTHYLSYTPDDNDGGYGTGGEGIAELLVIKNHKIVSRLPFEASDQVGLYRFKPYTSIRDANFFLIEYGYEACGYTHGQILCTYQNNKVDTISKQLTMSEAGVFGNYVDYLFPSDSGGRPKTVVEVLAHVEYDTDTYKQTSLTKEIEAYKYTGGRFVKE